MNNNNNSNNNFEPLFWKTIHNVYLFQKILSKIPELESEKNENRKKFKHIQSLEWMVKNKQYELLKCKLLSNNEFIDITENGLSKLFKNFEIEDDELIKEIIILLLNNKKIELKQFDLLSIAINQKRIEKENSKSSYKEKKEITENLKILKILLKEPFKVNTTLLEWSIQNSSIIVVNKLIKSKKFEITNTLKNKSITLALLNKEFKERIVKLILNNQLYNFEPFLPSTLALIKQSTFRVFENIEVKGADALILNVLSINNKNLKEELIKYIQLLVPINLQDSISCIINNSNINDKVKEIHKLLSIDNQLYYNSYLKNYNGEVIKSGEIKQEIIYCFLNFDLNILKWFISNNSMIRDKKYNISNSEFNYDNHKPIDRESESTYEFIKLYTSECESLGISNQDCDQEIKRLLLSSTTKEHYDKINESISPNSKLRKLISFPTKFNKFLINLSTWSIYHSKFIITDQESLDWIFENSNSMLLKSKLEGFSEKQLFQFDNLQLVEYAISKFEDKRNTVLYCPKILNPNHIFFTSLIYRYTYLKAIGNCDIKTLKFIDENIQDFKLLDDFDTRNYQCLLTGKSSNLTNQSTENIVNLINYLNNSGYKQFILDKQLYQEFIKTIVLRIPNLDLSKVNIKFCKELIPTISNMLIDSSYIDSFKIISFIVSSDEFDENQDYLLSIKNGRSKWDTLFYSDRIYSASYYYEDYDLYQSLDDQDIYDYNYNTNNRAKLNIVSRYQDQIMECIQVFIEKFNKIKTNNNNHIVVESNQDIILQVLQTIINNLFKSLIQTKGITFEKVNFIYGLLNNSQVKLEHSLFHSIYYIAIKSNKLIDYIMGLPFIHSICHNDGGPDFYEESDNLQYSGYNLKKYLDPFVFTWNYIFNSGASIDHILLKLIHNLSHLPAINDTVMITHEKDYLNFTLNSNLEYLLEIRNIDLFFNELDYTQQLLDNTSIKIGKFPTDENYNSIVISNCKNNCELEEIKNGRIFYLSNKIYQDALFVLNTSLFSRLIRFCNYESFINYLTYGIGSVEELDALLEYKDLINHILSEHNHSGHITSFKNWFLHNTSLFYENNSISFIVFKYHKLIFENHISELEVLDNETVKNNILLMELVLKSYPNHSIFK